MTEPHDDYQQQTPQPPTQSEPEVEDAEHFKVIISDLHLSAGRYYEGKLNPHEDFYFDQELCDFLRHFSSGSFGEGPGGHPVRVELFINGDFLDFLNVSFQGEFEDAISESLSLQKCQAIFAGHAEVMRALRSFAAKPGKTITYLIGNHDADLFFPRVQEFITRAWDPDGQYPSEKVRLIAHCDRVRLAGGIEVHHGNQFEAVHYLSFEHPILSLDLENPVLNLPWGSFYVLKILNRLRWERDLIDKVRPIKAFVFYGLLFDFRFTLRFIFLSAYYFLKTRFISSPQRKVSLRGTLDILRQEVDFALDLEKQARRLLDQEAEVKVVIFGHTHKPMNRIYPDGKQYINTGTWTKMIHLDLRNLGPKISLTFAFIRIQGKEAHAELREWLGEQSPHRSFHF